MLFIISGIGLLILLGLGAFFSAAETVMTALSRVDVRELQENHKEKGKQIEQLLEQPDRLIACLLIGNNIANICASVVVAYITEQYLGGFFIALSTFVLTFIIIVFSEIAPKQIGLIYKQKIVVVLVKPVLVFYKLFSPVLSLTLWLTKIIFPILKQELEPEDLEKSLEHMVDLAYEDNPKYENNSSKSYGSDIISANALQVEQEQEQRQQKIRGVIINNVLDEFREYTAKQIMTHRKNVFSVDASLAINQVYIDIIKSSYSRIPVYKGNKEHIVGILYLDDMQQFSIRDYCNNSDHGEVDNLTGRLSLNFEGATVEELMKSVGTFPDSVKVSELFSYFKDMNNGNLVIILDEYGGLAGVVSQEDVLETVFGKLYDEDEQESVDEIRKEGKGFVFAGELSIQQFEDGLNVKINIDKNTRFATIAGYICDVFGAIPEQGTEIERPEGRFTVLESDGKHIISLYFVPTLNS